jgi:CPA2 family monovalent cation:H+ antiporter-2
MRYRDDVPCSHLSAIRPVEPRTNGCEECLLAGDEWVHLRLCMTCGHVGCCDDSPNRHATKHYRQHGHPIVQSFEAGERWLWCFVDQLLMDPEPPEARVH